MHKVLVLGGSGFLGSKVVRELTFLGFEVIIVGSKAPSLIGAHKTNYFSIRRCHEIIELINDLNLSAVVNCAVRYEHNSNYAALIDTNIQLAYHSMLACLENKLPYVHSDSFFTKKEFSSYGAHERYISTKLIATGLLQHLRKTEELVASRLVFFHLYGENDHPQKFLPWLLNDLQKGKDINLTNGHQKRDFIYVDDAARAVGKVVKRIIEKPEGIRDLEVGWGKSFPIKYIVQLAKEIVGSDSKLVFGAHPMRRNEVNEIAADISNHTFFEWCPYVSLEQGLRRTIQKNKGS